MLALFSSAQATTVPDVLADPNNLKQVKKICWISSTVFVDGKKNIPLSNYFHSIQEMHFSLFAQGRKDNLQVKDDKTNCTEQDHVFRFNVQAFQQDNGEYLFHANFDVIALQVGALKYVTLWNNYTFGISKSLDDLESDLEAGTNTVLKNLFYKDW
ncbi:hypothetical protein GCM10008938_10120 [Deinococcus roseus]|uniref:Uncharacterized protein n=2 Tax=Deinococcus roseus TaxID=392414 RepID=A0ABQ2CVU6_9DEIO|nr:hypothetical protein GCM10008938_10120 [Deinococcus roseus]